MLMLLASPIAALTTTAVLKDDFRLLAARNDRGFSASASTIARLQAMATELEAATDSECFAPIKLRNVYNISTKNRITWNQSFMLHINFISVFYLSNSFIYML